VAGLKCLKCGSTIRWGDSPDPSVKISLDCPCGGKFRIEQKTIRPWLNPAPAPAPIDTTEAPALEAGERNVASE